MNKKKRMAIGVLLAAAGILIVAVSALLVGPLTEKQISRVTGVFSAYDEENPMFRPVVITRRIRLEDGREYTIGSDTQTSFDEDIFLAHVKAGDPIELIVAKQTGNVLAIYQNGREYLDYEESQSSRGTNLTIGLIIGAALALAGTGVLVILRAR